MSRVLKELFSRSGPSDQDKEAWLEARTHGITATEVKTLVKGYDPAALAIMKVLPHDPNAPALDNKFLRWGVEREPIIAQYVSENIEPSLILEHRVFSAQENERYLASPDMVGDLNNELILAEIKTSKNNLASDSPAFAKSGYDLQMQWQMLVCGADRCLFTWESHANDWGPDDRPQTVYPIESFWVDRDEDVIKLLRSHADPFLVMLDEIRKDLSL